MITYEFDEGSLSRLNRKLVKIGNDAPKALKNAINKTARKTRTDLKKGARAEYTSAKAGPIGSGMTMQIASNANLQAKIFIKGRPMLVNTGFRATTPKRGAKVGVKGGLRELIGPSGIRGFGGDGGIVLQRKTAARRPLRAAVGPSVPNMMRPEGPVYQKVEPEIQSNLRKEVEAQVDRILKS
ncbi:MAG: hypothetical protein LUC16_01600 [Coprobacillus sp.]|nr:hypothetical protein [Coprobacillus sp.]